MDEKKSLELLEHAREALKLSYSPYSNYAVGAAILCRDGSIYLGANIENASYPAGICAERSAVSNAMAHGHRDFVAIAIVNTRKTPCYPCGICRQVLAELMPEGQVILENMNGYESHKIREIMPMMFLF